MSYMKDADGVRLDSISAVSQLHATAATTTAAVNAWLSAASPLGVKRLVGALTLTAPLVIPSGRLLEATGATITSSVDQNFINNAAVSTFQRSVADAVTTAASTTITSNTANFTTADIGRSFTLGGAGLADGTKPLAGTITAVASTTSATISYTALRTQTGAALTLYDRDADITVRGGTWVRTVGAGGGTNATHTMLFRRVDRLKIRDVRFTTTVGKYAISLGDVADSEVDGFSGTTNSDGVHVNGPATGVRIRNVAATTGDDLATFNAADYVSYADTTGPIYDVRFSNIRAINAKQAVAGYVDAGHTADEIVLDGVTGTTTAHGTMWTGPLAGAGAGGVFGTIRIKNLAVTPSSAYSPLWTGYATIRDLFIDGLSYLHPTSTAAGVKVDLSATIRNITVRDFVFNTAATGAAPAISVASVVTGTILLAGVVGTLVTGQSLIVANASTAAVSRVEVVNDRTNGGNAIVQVSGGHIDYVSIANSSHNVGTWIVYSSAPMVVNLSGSNFYNLTGGLFRVISASGNVTVYSGGCTYSYTSATMATIDAGGTLTASSDEIPIDLTIAGTHRVTGYSNEFGGAALTGGDETIDRRIVGSNSLAVANGVMRLTYFTARRTETIANVRVLSGATAAVGTTHALIGIYTVDSSGNLTLVAQTTDDTTLFGTANTSYTKALTASFVKEAGRRYAVGWLVTATTQPSIMGANMFAGVALAEGGIAPRIVASTGSGLSALPSSVAVGSLGNQAGVGYAVLTP